MSSNDIAISVRNLSKSYTIAHNAQNHTTAGEALMHRLKSPFQRVEKETFWALKDISFDIERGDVVGIIGRNGAGKSTLLKILSRITEPTTGDAYLYGRVGSLLEVGTGFHGELTGRENIYLNGAILGMKKREIDRQFDAIVDFAGVDQFLETPVKRYSSGMYVRLAFAVAAHLNPEILVVDEVLAVGDAEFQKKCLGKMKDVAQSGRTVLFVSHNMAAVNNLCSSAIVLQRGRMSFQGATGAAFDRYLSSSPGGAEETSEEIGDLRPSWARPWIVSARIVNPKGDAQNRFPMGSDITVEMTFAAPDATALEAPVMGVDINHATFGLIGRVNTRMTGFEAHGGAFASATMRCTLRRLPFLQGQYSVDLWLGEGSANIDYIHGYLRFHIEESDIYGTGRVPFAHMGIAFLEPVWTITSENQHDGSKHSIAGVTGTTDEESRTQYGTGDPYVL